MVDREYIRNILVGLLEWSELSRELKTSIRTALNNIDNPLNILDMCDNIIKSKHPSYSRANNPDIFPVPWNPYTQDSAPTFTGYPENFEFYSLGSERGRESSLTPGSLNGGLFINSNSNLYLYDPGIDFHIVVKQIMSYKKKFFTPKVNFILVSHSHFDHSAGLVDALAWLSGFFRKPFNVQVIAPSDVLNKFGLNDFSKDVDFIKIFSTFHGKGKKVKVFHFLVENKYLLISDSQVFRTIGRYNPVSDGISFREMYRYINEGKFTLTEEFQGMFDYIRGIGGVENALLTYQCSDILPGDFPKVSTAYHLAKNNLAKRIFLVGWGAENVFGGKDIFPRISLPKLIAYSLNLMFPNTQFFALESLTYF